MVVHMRNIIITMTSGEKHKTTYSKTLADHLLNAIEPSKIMPPVFVPIADKTEEDDDSISSGAYLNPVMIESVVIAQPAEAKAFFI